MSRYRFHGAAIFVLTTLAVASMAGVSGAAARPLAAPSGVSTSTLTRTTPTFTTALSSPSVPFGSSAVDFATVTGNAGFGAPTGYVTFEACGPTATAAACTSPNVGPATVELSPRSASSSTASVSIDPGAPGWYCFLDFYSGDRHYTSATDNDTATECLDVTTTAPTKTTPTFTTALGSPSVPLGSSSVDTATVTGSAGGGAPTGSVTFAVCGPTASPTACTSPNVSSVTVGLSPQTSTSSTASVTLEPGAPGWYCFLDTYSGDTHYTSVTDNDTATECLDVTTTAPTKTTPTFTTALNSPSVAFGGSAVDTATVTGNSSFGAPTGTVTFEACGPTATPTPCTTPNIGPATVGLSPRTTTSATARVTIYPGAPGWYCFLDTYSGDTHYTSATDNDTATECLDVTSSSASYGSVIGGNAHASIVVAPATTPGPASTPISGGPAALSSVVKARRQR